MADAPKSPSTTDLFLLIAGLKLVKNPDTSADFGEDYYLKPPANTQERTPRDIDWNENYLNSPNAAWQNVKFRDWLLAQVFSTLCDHKHDFKAIAEPVIASIDLLGKKFTKDMAGTTDKFRQFLTSENGYERTFYSTLTFGITKQRAGTKDVFVFGAGMRRTIELWLTSQEALTADLEFFVPFYVLPNKEHGDALNNAMVQSVSAGIIVSKSNNSPIAPAGDILAMRFNFRIPFRSAEKTTLLQKELHTNFGTPEIKLQKRVKGNEREWVPFDNYKKFLEDWCEQKAVSDLLNSPIGPLLAEKISSESSIKDVILTPSKREEIKKELIEGNETLKDQLELLKSVWQWQPPDAEKGEAHSGSRKLGSVLESLGFMSGKPPSDGEIEYSFKLASGLTVWKVLDALIDELDGFPLYITGLKSRKDRSAQGAFALATQKSFQDPTKHYFGLAGLAYNIPLKTVSEDDPDKKKKKPDEPSIVLSKDNFTKDESILIDPEEDEQEESETGGGDNQKPEEKKAETSTSEVFLHLGKWFSNETLDDNWLLRLMPKTDGGKPRIPLPGIRLLPIKRIPSSKDFTKATFSWTVLLDLLSLGIDIRSTTKEGLGFIEGVAGYFGLGAFEVRLAIKVSFEEIYKEKSFFDRLVFGVGIKLKDLRLSLGPKEEKKDKGKGDEVIEGLSELLADDWAVVPASDKKPNQPKIKTRLSAKKKDKFSISIGYLSPLKAGSQGTLDVQIYDDKGNRGKMAIIPIDRFADPIYIKQIGIGLKGLENVELSKGIPDSAQLTVMLTGGFRLPVAELGFIGAKLSFPLNAPEQIKFSLDGVDVSFKIGPVIISGSFMKAGLEYGGSLTVSIPKGSFSAMGFFGSLLVFDMKSEVDFTRELNLGRVPKKLSDKLIENKIKPIAEWPVVRSPGGDWDLVTTDDKHFTLSLEDGKLNVLRPDKTFFVYVTLSAAAGTGIPVGPITFTGIVFGYGYNRRAKIPTIENVADFPLVKMVMGQGGYQHEDDTFELQNQLAKAIEDPISVFQKMQNYLVPELGRQFACGGVRFTISGTIDCFALVIVQWGNEEFEISLLGLARFRLPRDTTVRPICYIELQILMTLKPSEGIFKLEALLSNNSWIINKDCKLTGGFAVYVWFAGDHKGDVVVTLGGYHPKFARPAHYPLVPRLGLNWPVTDNLSIKGGCYFAYTPSCGMFGAKLEAAFHSGRISAWFTAYLDVVINWSPLFFEAELGISLRVEVGFAITSIKITISAQLLMWGPPVGGVAHIDLTVCSFDIKFGEARPKKVEVIDSWQQFCHGFLNLSGQDRQAVASPVKAFPLVQPNLAAGRNNLNNLPLNRRKEAQVKPEDGVWKVRADELDLAATAAVPVTALNVGNAKSGATSEGIQLRTSTGQSLMTAKAVTLDSKGLRTKNSANKLGVHPMGKTLDSVLNVTIVRDEVSTTSPMELSGWTFEEEKSAVPAALWKPEKPVLTPEVSAKLIDGCITGIKQLKPPRGKLGKRAVPPSMGWHPLTPGTVARPTTEQERPTASQTRNIQPTVAQKLDSQKQMIAALAAAGYSLSWQAPSQADVRFRELQANPLAGAVAG